MDKGVEAAERYCKEQERTLRMALGDEGYGVLEELVRWTDRVEELRARRS